MTGFSDVAVQASGEKECFRIESSQVLDSLRSRIADVLSELGVFTKPAEVQRALGLDKTLSRQVFKLASTAETMASGSVVPSRTSICRFIDVAKDRGIDAPKLQGVLGAFERFERLIRIHAGDRVTFNSMVSATTGIDDEWLAADLQHRRNAFRTMSHTMGMQIKTRLRLFVISGSEDGKMHDIALISGCIGFRVLRAMPIVRVDGFALSPIHGSGIIPWEPLGLSDTVDGYVLEPFCSKPLPKLKISDGKDALGKWKEIAIEQPEVGNLGTSTLMLGTVCRNMPVENEPLRVHATTGKPAEVMLSDVLIDPKISRGRKPAGSAVLGLNLRFGSELFPLEGKFEPESLGKGPSAVATPEVPRYSEMLRAVAEKLGWDLSEFNAWRMRMEYPLYQSTLTMSWDAPK